MILEFGSENIIESKLYYIAWWSFISVYSDIFSHVCRSQSSNSPFLLHLTLILHLRHPTKNPEFFPTSQQKIFSSNMSIVHHLFFFKAYNSTLRPSFRSVCQVVFSYKLSRSWIDHCSRFLKMHSLKPIFFSRLKVEWQNILELSKAFCILRLREK